MIDSAVTLLPQPDSPAMQSVLPAGRRSEMPSTARTAPGPLPNVVTRLRTSRAVSLAIGNSFRVTEVARDDLYHTCVLEIMIPT